MASRKLIVGKNDFKTEHPELLLYVDGWDPTQFRGNSTKVMNWKCEKSHTWSSPIYNMTRPVTGGKSRCPFCINQKIWIGFNDLTTTHPKLSTEADGWDPSTLSAGSNKIVNWKCIDGHSWKTQVKSRAILNTKCPFCIRSVADSGITDLASTHPILASEANGWDPATYLSGSGKIKSWKCSEGHIWNAEIKSRAHNGNGCPYCSGNFVTPGKNDLRTTHPELLKFIVDWNPSNYSAASHSMKLWKCEIGHEFGMRISKRAWSGQDCPYCMNKKLLRGFNDLLTVDPQLSEEADGWDPSNVLAGSGKRVNWKCSEGHTWAARLSERRQGRGCRTCSNFGFSRDEEGWLYLLHHENWELLQIGISNNIKERLHAHSRLDWEVRDVIGPVDGALVENWEKEILKFLKIKGAVFAPITIAGKFDGYTECWMEQSYKVVGIKEIMEKIRAEE